MPHDQTPQSTYARQCVEEVFAHWYERTEEAVAAAVLAQCELQLTRMPQTDGEDVLPLHGALSAKRVADELGVSPPSPKCNDGLLNLKEAASYLGYSPGGLRKLINQKRIRFMQHGDGPIKFRRDWLDSFVTENTGGPATVERSAARQYRPRNESKPQFGFDPSLLASNPAA